jgi:hypothetical protein
MKLIVPVLLALGILSGVFILPSPETPGPPTGSDPTNPSSYPISFDVTNEATASIFFKYGSLCRGFFNSTYARVEGPEVFVLKPAQRFTASGGLLCYESDLYPLHGWIITDNNRLNDAVLPGYKVLNFALAKQPLSSSYSVRVNEILTNDCTFNLTYFRLADREGQTMCGVRITYGPGVRQVSATRIEVSFFLTGFVTTNPRQGPILYFSANPSARKCEYQQEDPQYARISFTYMCNNKGPYIVQDLFFNQNELVNGMQIL